MSLGAGLHVGCLEEVDDTQVSSSNTVRTLGEDRSPRKGTQQTVPWGLR